MIKLSRNDLLAQIQQYQKMLQGLPQFIDQVGVHFNDWTRALYEAGFETRMPGNLPRRKIFDVIDNAGPLSFQHLFAEVGEEWLHHPTYDPYKFLQLLLDESKEFVPLANGCWELRKNLGAHLNGDNLNLYLGAIGKVAINYVVEKQIVHDASSIVDELFDGLEIPRQQLVEIVTNALNGSSRLVRGPEGWKAEMCFVSTQLAADLYQWFDSQVRQSLERHRFEADKQRVLQRMLGKKAA